MPFVDDAELPEPMGRLGTGAIARQDLDYDERPDLVDVLKAGFGLENVPVSVYLDATTGAPRNVIPPDFDPNFDAIAENKGTWFEAYPEEFQGIFSPTYLLAQRAKLRRERKFREDLARSGGLGFTVAMLAGMLDPITFIPIFGSAAKVRSIAKGAAIVGGTAGVATGVQEALLHATQSQRTLAESATGVGASVILGGAIGGATARLNLRPRVLAAAATADRVEIRARLRNALKDLEGTDSLAEFTRVTQQIERARREMDRVMGRPPDDAGPVNLTQNAEQIRRLNEQAEQFLVSHFLDPKLTKGMTSETIEELRRFISQNAEDIVAGRMSLEDATDLAVSTLDKRLLTGDELFEEHLRGLGRTVDYDTGAGGPVLSTFLNPWVQGIARRVQRRLSRIANRRHLQAHAKGLSEQMKALDEAMKELQESMQAGTKRLREDQAGEGKVTTPEERARLTADTAATLHQRMRYQRDLVAGIMRRGQNFVSKLMDEAARRAHLDPGAYRETIASVAEWHRLRADAFDRIALELEHATIAGAEGALKRSPEIGQMIDDLKAASLGARKEADRILEDAIERFGNIEGVTQLPPIIDAEFSEPQLNAQNKVVVPGAMIEMDLSNPYALRTATEDFLKVQNTKLGVEHLMAPFFPGLRVALKSPVAASRLTMLRLADMGFDWTFNRLGVRSPVSVESNINAWRANLGQAIQDTQDAYLKYRRGIDPEEKLLMGTATIRRGKEFLGIMREDVSARIKGEPRKFLSFSEFRSRVGRAMRNDDIDTAPNRVPEVEEAARSWRANIFDPIRDQALELGLMKHLDELKRTQRTSYLTRVYNVRKILAQEANFKQILRNHVEEAAEKGANATEIEAAVNEIFDRITKSEAGRAVNWEELKLTRSRVFKERVLDIDDRIIAPWLEDDIEIVGRFYERTAVPDIELQKAFGSIEMAEQIAEIESVYKKLIKGAPNAEAATKLRKQQKNDIGDIEAIRDVLRGTFGQPGDPNEVPTRFMKAIRRFNLMRQAGSFVLSSVPDIARPVMVHGLANTFADGLVPLVTNFQTFRLMAGEARLAGTAWEVVLNTRAALIADVGDDFGRHTGIERFLENGANLTMLVNLMSPWNDALKQFTSVLTSTAILRAGRKVGMGKKLGRGEKNRLAQLGLDEDLLLQIDQQVQKQARPDDSLPLPRTVEWDNDVARIAFRAALRREVDHAIVTPAAADRPLFFSKEIGKTILQYKSFMMAATLRISLMGLQRTDAAHLNGMMLGVTLGMMSYAMKSVQYGFKLSDKPQDWVIEGLDRFGGAAALFEVNNTLEVMSRGKLGLAPLIGGTPTNRFSKRYKFPGAVLGPTYGLAEDLFSLAGSVAAGDMQPRDARYFRNLMAWQNVFYWDPVVDVPFDALARSFRE